MIILVDFAFAFICLWKPHTPEYPTCFPSSGTPDSQVVENVEQWRSVIEPGLFSHNGLSSALVLAVIAQESRGDAWVIAPDGGIGLMQIMSRNYWDEDETVWLIPSRNIQMGMTILSQSIEQADGDIRLALAWYNCGEVRLEQGKCGLMGGYFYAERVLSFWCPAFETNLQDGACSEYVQDIRYRFGNLVSKIKDGGNNDENHKWYTNLGRPNR